MGSYTNYVYDGDGNRLEKSSGGIYWYGAGTEILDESDQSGNFTNEYVFFGGKRIAMRNVSTGTIYYYEEDMLGSSRTIVQSGGTSPCYDADFYPFGGERVVTNTCSQNYKFEGKERDTETGDDDFGARYYASRLGRWLSADWSSVPAPVPYANLTNPQTLNLYAMVSDNPESFADLDGHSYNPSFNVFTEFTGCGVELKECPDQQPTSQNTGAAGAITSSIQQATNTPSTTTQQDKQPGQLTAKAIDAPTSLGVPEVQDSAAIIVVLHTSSDLPGKEATVAATLSFDKDKKTKGGLVLDTVDAGSSSALGGKPVNGSGAGTTIAIKVTAITKNGSFGGTGGGFIRFSVTDVNGHTIRANLDVYIHSRDFADEHSPNNHTVGPSDFRQRIVVPINQQ